MLTHLMLTVALVAAPPTTGQITATSGDWSIVFDAKRAWTIHHIDFRQETVAHEGGGQCASLDAGNGWIGGTNTTGGPEPVESVEITVNGDAAELEVGRTYQGETVIVKRVSSLDKLSQTSLATLTPEGVTLTVELSAPVEQPVKSLYAYLFNWQPSFGHWAAETTEGELLQGVFANAKGNHVSRPARWAALYDETKKLGVVSLLGDEAAKVKTNFWDQPQYHKQILDVWPNKPMPAGTTLNYTLTLKGFTAEPEAWLTRAAQLAGADLKALAEKPGEGMITVKTRDWEVAFASDRAWTLHHTLYRGHSTSHPNGFHGAVIDTGVMADGTAGVGWIGTGHTEGGREKVESIALTLDGQPVDLVAGQTYQGSEFILHKRSTIGTLAHEATITVGDEQITEHHVFEASDDQPLKTFYAFMHTWEPSFDRWAAAKPDGERISGLFSNGGGHQIDGDVAWSAIYDSQAGIGLVTDYPEPYLKQEGGIGTFFWDLERYHKQYLSLFGKTVWPKGRKLEVTLGLRGFAAPADGWADRAAELAAAMFAEG